MKNFKFLLVPLAGILFACTNNYVDLVPPSASENVFLPMNGPNYWTYKVASNLPLERDSLYIYKDTTIGGFVYKKFKTKEEPVGFFSNSIYNNSIRKSGDQLLIFGKSALDFGANLPIDLVLNDFVGFKEVTTNNELVGSFEGVLNQTIASFPLEISYKLKSYGQPPLSSFTTSQGKTYADVKPMKIVVNVGVNYTTVVAGVPVSLSVMSPQDVIVSTQYFAKNKGMVYAKTVVSYQLQSLPTQISLPIPASGTETQEEFLDVFMGN
jgi:hypothetical protein